MIDKMYKNQFVRLLTKAIRDAEKVVIEKYNSKTVQEEEDITTRLAAEIESHLNNHKYEGVMITAKVFTRKGRNSEEKITGADLGVILNINNGQIQKAFLSQAKKGQYNNGNIKLDRNKLDIQCKKMLNISSDSFIFIYTSRGIFVVPAFNYRNTYLNHKNLGNFFFDFLTCFIGDHKIIDFVKRPEYLLEYANHVLYLQIESLENEW